MLKSKIIPLSALALVVFFAGCSKRQAPAPAATQPETAPVAAAPATETPPADAAPQAPSGPVFDTSQFTGDPKQAMADADAAFRQREYEKAVRTMLAVQQAQLNAQQAAAARQQMIALQRNLANAVASGDPNAAQAAQILRAAHSH